jgi:hypothetical protein
MQYTAKKLAENHEKMRELGIRDAGDLDIEHDGLVDDDETKPTPQALRQEAAEKKE